MKFNQIEDFGIVRKEISISIREIVKMELEADKILPHLAEAKKAVAAFSKEGNESEMQEHRDRFFRLLSKLPTMRIVMEAAASDFLSKLQLNGTLKTEEKEDMFISSLDNIDPEWY